MADKYVIRQASFQYDDYLYFGAMGAIISDIFSDYDEAHNHLLNLERDMYLSIDLSIIEPFSSQSSNYDIDKMANLKYYFDTELGLEILNVGEYGRIFAESDSFLPANITNEQIEKIRDLSGLKFYKLIGFVDDPIFYGIWKKKPFYTNDGFEEAGVGTIYFYDSYIEAYNTAINRCFYRSTELKGKLEDISDTPVILEALIKANPDCLSYNKNTEIMQIGRLDIDTWASLCILLKDKPFEIKILNFEDVKNCEQSVYDSIN